MFRQIKMTKVASVGLTGICFAFWASLLMVILWGFAKTPADYVVIVTIMGGFLATILFSSFIYPVVILGWKMGIAGIIGIPIGLYLAYTFGMIFRPMITVGDPNRGISFFLGFVLFLVAFFVFLGGIMSTEKEMH